MNGKKEKVLYLHTYDGYYCVSCETFITEGLLVDNPSLCPDCKKPLEKMKEDTYFFRLSAYQDRLTNDIRQGKFRILPETRKNEVLGFLEHNKLTDLSVSRPKSRLAWGIPLPFDDNHVTYVWFDALVNYISACGYGRDEKMFAKWWPADVHIIGKDIIRHHAVLWPIFLYALGVEPPKMIFAHGWWVQGGEKMSKSRGNAVDPVEIVKQYGVDPYRHFLLREAPFGADGTFSEEALALRYNTDLANDLGNLLNRTLTMCEKYFEGRIPDFPDLSGNEQSLVEDVRKLKAKAVILFDKVENAMGRLAFSEALADIWDLISESNRFIEKSAPWTLFKQKRIAELQYIMLYQAEVLKVIAQLVWPFMPDKAEEIWKQLGIESPIDKLEKQSMGWSYSMLGKPIAKGAPLFPRIEAPKQEA